MKESYEKPRITATDFDADNSVVLMSPAGPLILPPPPPPPPPM
ncbi:hypothetical protein [Cyclonatronum sp.]|nr:hypothetical protein [Cyclonatronum sp.]